MTEQPTPSAPLTPEEVEKLIWRHEKLLKDNPWDMPDEVMNYTLPLTEFVTFIDYIRSLRTRAEQAEAQLKSRTEDAERMAGALKRCSEVICSAKMGDIPVVTLGQSAARNTANEVLSSLHHSYPPKQ